MKYTLSALFIALFPVLSFAQNGNVSFGFGSAPNGGATQTNTAASSTTTSMGMGFDNNADQQSPPCPGPMSAAGFKSGKETVAKASYEDTKLTAAKTIIAANCLSVEQVIQVCKLFGFEQTKLDFAKMAWSKTTDRSNYSKVESVFTYDASKKTLNNFISNGGK